MTNDSTPVVTIQYLLWRENGFGNCKLFVENSHKNDFLPAPLISDYFSESMWITSIISSNFLFN